MELYKFPTCSASSCSLVIPCFFVNVIDRRVKVAIRQVDDTWDRYVRFPTSVSFRLVVVQAGRVRFIESTVRRYDTMDRIIRQRGQPLCQRALSSNRSVSKRLFSDYRVSPTVVHSLPRSLSFWFCAKIKYFFPRATYLIALE